MKVNCAPINKLKEAYADGLLEQDEFEPRIKRARDRLDKLQKESEAQADRETQQRV